MESVIQINQCTGGEVNTQQANTHIAEIVVDGCQVKMRFGTDGDRGTMASILSILVSARSDATLAIPVN